MTLIPISVRYHGKQYWFPREYRGKLVEDALATKLWRETVPAYYGLEVTVTRRVTRETTTTIRLIPPPLRKAP